MARLRHVVLLALALGLALALTGPRARAQPDAGSAPPITVTQDSRWVQGQVVVGAPPEVVWARLQDVRGWPSLLSDIKRLEIKEHRGARWEVGLETRTLPQGMLDYHVDIEPGRRVRLWRKGGGVAVQAYTLVRPGPTPGESNVVYSLYIRLTGVPSLLISEGSLREKERHMVRTTLADLRRAYPPRAR